MALTISEQFRAQMGGRKWIFLQVTHDEATSTFTAASVDLTYVEYVQHSLDYVASEAADLSVYALYTNVSITLDGSTINFGLPPKAGSKSRLMLIGW